MDALEDDKHHERQRFQLERLILFTDAVFAIAITLLIIEIKVPFADKKLVTGIGLIVTNEILKEEFLHLTPEWIGFFISFVVIAVYWNAHHRMFGFVEAYDVRLVTLNFLFLVTIIIMPFTTAFYTKWTNFNFPFGLYCFNVSLAGFSQVWLWLHLSNQKKKLSKRITPIIRKTMLIRSLVAPSIFLIAYSLSFHYFNLARTIFLIIPFIMGIISWYFKRKGFNAKDFL